MANFFTRALDKITPWRRGGEVQRDQQAAQAKKKKRDEEEARNQSGLSVGVARPNQNIVVENQQQQLQTPTLQRPENLFEGLQKNLTIGQPNPILAQQNTAPTPAPVPGTVIKPTLSVKPAINTRQLLVGGKPVEDTPENKINRGLDRGQSFEDIARENNFRLEGVREYATATRPNYGIKIERPKQSIGNRFRDVFDANTESDKFRRQEGNKYVQPEQQKELTLRNPGNIVSRTPIVGTVTKMANTGYRQLGEIDETIEGAVLTKMQSDLTKEMLDAQKRGDRTKYEEAKYKLDILIPKLNESMKAQDELHTKFQKNSGGLFNAGTLYDEEGSRSGDIKTGLKDIVLPTAVTMADIYTLGQGAAISEGIKQGGLRVGARTVAPNIIKAGAGNFASGAGSTVSEGGNAGQAVKSGLINSILGLVPDIGLPAIAQGFKSRVVPRIMRGKAVNPADVVEELDDAAISASVEAANQALKPRPIPVNAIEDIPVNAIEGLPQPIRVRNLNEPAPLIQEFPGDASVATPNALIQKTAEDIRARSVADAAFDQAKTAPAPNPAIEGITTPRPNPAFTLDETAVKGAQDKLIDDYAAFLRDMGEGNGTQLVPDGEGGYFRTSNNYRPGMGTGKLTKAQWREEAERQLREGKADPSLQKAFDEAADPEVQALLSRGDTTEEAPVGRPIQVKQATGIPVDEINVPTGLPETPGTVRATTQTSPMAAKSEAVANAPVVARPAQLPAETQAILDNPKQYSKRQVAAARNQRKLARQLAKTTEQTAEAAERINTASPAAASPEGYVATGEFGRSVNGGAYQKVSRAAEMTQAIEETANMSPADILGTARKNQANTGGFDPRDMRNIRALAQSRRLKAGTPEWQEMRQILKEDGTIWGQQGALRNYTMRRTASADELVSRYESKIYRLAEDPTKIEGKWFDEIEQAETAYTQARDDAVTAYNRFTEAPTTANAKAYHAAQDAADKADKTAKMTEYKVADKALKGNKDVKQMRELEKMANEADLYQMDAVDASMLSGTGTFVRNTVNAAVGGVEESLFGGAASRIVRKLTRQNIGGGVGKGNLSGFGEGSRNLVDASMARAGNAGKNPFSHIKNWATTGNQLGDTIIDSQTAHNVLDHYTSILKEQGYRGRELRDRAGVMARQDPDNLGKMYAGAARTAAGLGTGVTRGNKIETFVKNQISDLISGGKPNKFTEATAKLVTRMTIGFPTAIGRSTVEGVKRFTLGAPTFVKAIRTTDPVQRALLIKEGIKQAGTGTMVIPPLFYALGAAGAITGSYPKDPEERARWEREGITENSVKIGDDYYQLPGYLGAWAVPGLFYASLGRNEGDFAAATADTAKIIPALLPTDQASNIMDVINGRTDLGKFMSQTGASAVRATTPGGALLNQISKSLDPTKNDTTSGTNWENFVDKVASGIPGVNNMAGIPDKVDDAGNPIANPDPAALLLGAASTSQDAGIERSGQIQAQVDTGLKTLEDFGVLGDPNLLAVLDDKEKAIYDKLQSGKKLGEGDLKKLEEAFVKGVSTTGEDTAYLEREQYDTNLAALKLKKKRMEEDKTVKPSDIKKMETAIKRGEVYKEAELPYDMIEAYQSIGIDEWRKMGDPEDDDYDPDMYQKLYDIDQMMTKAGVSYKKGALDKNKYYAKEKKGGSGSGRSRSSELSSDFGKLKAGNFAPNVRAYDTIDQKSGSVPIIRTVRPNIVHKIGSSG